MFKKIIILQLSLLIILIISCKQSPIARSLSDSDRLIIQFIEQGNIVKTVTTEDKNAINKMIYALDKGEATVSDCVITGKMIFYKNNDDLQEVNFSTTPGCRYFLYPFENSQVISSMTNETANFLQSVKEGLDYY